MGEVTMVDADEVVQAVGPGDAAHELARASGVLTSGSGERYEGTVTRNTDGRAFLQAVELGAGTGSQRPVRIFEQLSGALPAHPQFSGNAQAAGFAFVFTLSDAIAHRAHMLTVVGNALFSVQMVNFFDGRPHYQCAGLLTKTGGVRGTAMTGRRETQRILNVLPSRGQEEDWGLEAAAAAGLMAGDGIPPKVDLREDWWTVGDQGDTGSCVGWATADSVLRWHFVKAGRLPARDLLSSRFVWMAAKETDEFVQRPTTFIEQDGTSLKAALDVARRFGAATSAALPFDGCRLFQGDTSAFYALCAQRRITSYFNLGRSLPAWRRWLAQNGPILVRLDVDATWDTAAETGGYLDRYESATARGGHAVALVGYTADHFVVRNSWGAGWGDDGFGYASDAYAQAAFTEAYGVAV